MSASCANLNATAVAAQVNAILVEPKRQMMILSQHDIINFGIRGAINYDSFDDPLLYTINSESGIEGTPLVSRVSTKRTDLHTS